MLLLREYLNREIDNLDRNNIRFRTIGRTGSAGSLGPRRNWRRPSTGPAQYRNGVYRRLELRRPRRNRRCCESASCRPARIGRRSGVSATSLYVRTPGSRSVDTNKWGNARQQFSALADCLYRNLRHGHAVADFSRKDLHEAIVAFQKRERRYGGLGEAPVLSTAKE